MPSAYDSKPWLSPEAGWPADVPTSLDIPAISLFEMLAESAVRNADQRVLRFLGRDMTYRELLADVEALAGALYAHGVRFGDPVGLLLPNCPQYVIAYYACMRLGAVASGINPTYKPVEVLHQLRTVKATTLIALDVLVPTAVLPILAASPVTRLLVTNIADSAGLPWLKRQIATRFLKRIPYATPPSFALSFRALLRERKQAPPIVVPPEATATAIMTGGTTGVPKAAVLSHANLVANAMQARAWLFRLGPGACNVGVLPLFHSFAMTAVMNVSIRAGAWMLLFPKPPATVELIARIEELGTDGRTIYAGAEVLFQRLAEFPGIAQTRLKDKLELCVSGAGPLHQAVRDAFETNVGARLAEGYGLTEASPVVSAQPFWGTREAGTIGLPLPNTEWIIMDAAAFGTPREPCPLDQAPDPERHIGELCVSGPQVMQGYLDRPADTAETLQIYNGKRWLLTGDIGYMDTLGRVRLLDRKKQLIKVRGYSVFPREVEELLGMHEAIAEVAVAGVPDAANGEAIKAWVVLKPEWQGRIHEEDLVSFARASFAHYKVPREIEFRKELPKSLVGKVLRRTLQEEHRAKEKGP